MVYLTGDSSTGFCSADSGGTESWDSDKAPTTEKQAEPGVKSKPIP